MTLFQFKRSEQPSDHVHIPEEVDHWHVLVVDDEQAIHDVTQLVLAGVEVFGRPLKLHFAYNGTEARSMLQNGTEFAMAFVDVVMESDSAGLELVSWIREKLQNQSIRLVLRTGQAGMAPEEDVIRRYDINDYKTKTEFTALKMTTSVISGIRSYRDIETILRNLREFRNLIRTSNTILKVQNLEEFALAALDNMLPLLHLKGASFYMVRHEDDFMGETRETVVACSGREGVGSHCVSAIPEKVRRQIGSVFRLGQNVQARDYFVAYFQTSATTRSVFYVKYADKGEHFNARLAELYITNIALILENLIGKQQLADNQRELMYIVGEAVEARSKETGSHVKRVAILSELLARKVGLPDSFCAAIKTAAPLHDIGKIAIPDNILGKPGKLDAAEWSVMQSHAEIGGNMLAKSHLPVAQLGSRIARYHHENWDGSGYPEGLSGEQIPIEARIMALVDVFDALGAKRCYKDPWSLEDIRGFIETNRGVKFDPQLVELFFESFDEMVATRDRYPD
ncbi:HD domain-containing phosphohydrolase [Aliamphritea hakodatensis]|uniref:HD domain-containing phosphohydrolase n=1 Tax=Aliamphritea hakodatensis TaxID=2895352 RepID=UPI0022FD397B|nr:HD domain-containing phosphohydrolase [Aliamphritea hakodatensis]